jgi:hypothetical protein
VLFEGMRQDGNALPHFSYGVPVASGLEFPARPTVFFREFEHGYRIEAQATHAGEALAQERGDAAPHQSEDARIQSTQPVRIVAISIEVAEAFR